MKFSLDSLTKEVKKRQTVVSAVGDLSSIREKLKIYEHREKELDIEILELKNSPFPDNNTKVSFRSFLVFTRNIIKVIFPSIRSPGDCIPIYISPNLGSSQATPCFSSMLFVLGPIKSSFPKMLFMLFSLLFAIAPQLWIQAFNKSKQVNIHKQVLLFRNSFSLLWESSGSLLSNAIQIPTVRDWAIAVNTTGYS